MASEKRLIDADALVKDIDKYYQTCIYPHPGTTWRRGLELAVELLLEAPTVDAVEVIRCRDCKRFVDNKEARVTYCRRSLQDMTVNPNDFCSYGERRKNERE